MRPRIPPGSVAKARNMPDIPALSRLAIRAPEHLKSVNLFLREPLAASFGRHQADILRPVTPTVEIRFTTGLAKLRQTPARTRS